MDERSIGIQEAREMYMRLESCDSTIERLLIAFGELQDWVVLETQDNNALLGAHGVCYCHDCREQIGRGRALYQVSCLLKDSFS